MSEPSKCERDRQGDVWVEGDDGLMHTPETMPFTREHVEKKWGPLVPVTVTGPESHGSGVTS